MIRCELFLYFIFTSLSVFAVDVVCAHTCYSPVADSSVGSTSTASATAVDSRVRYILLHMDGWYLPRPIDGYKVQVQTFAYSIHISEFKGATQSSSEKHKYRKRSVQCEVIIRLIRWIFIDFQPNRVPNCKRNQRKLSKIISVNIVSMLTMHNLVIPWCKQEIKYSCNYEIKRGKGRKSFL